MIARARKAAFTLIELLVYMVIMGFIIVVAGRVFSDSTAMRVRSQSMLVSSEEAGRVSALLKEDISQMGAKSWAVSNAGGEQNDFISVNTVQIGNGDLSSYELTKNTPETEDERFDKLSFRKAHYDTNGVCGAVLKIEWYVEYKGKDSILVRKCTSQDEAQCTGVFNLARDCPPEEVEMASGVAEFRFLPSRPGTPQGAPPSNADTLYPANNALNFIRLQDNVPMNQVLSGFNLLEGNNNPAPDRYLLALPNAAACFPINFIAGEEYAIEFNLNDVTYDTDECLTGESASCDRVNKMAMFQAGRDHLSIGLRDPNGNPINISGRIIPDFLFYPPQKNIADAIRRHFVLSVPETVNACIGITAALYSEAAQGHLDFENFRVLRKTDRVYHFDRNELEYNPADNKDAVKAFELTFGVEKRGELSRTVTVIPVPSNGRGGL